VPNNDVNQLKAAIVKQPVSVSIDANCDAFMNYSSGIFTESCGTDIDHAVLAVGYGSEDSQEYWIVKNSWGPMWGDHGYIMMEKEPAASKKSKKPAHSACGIAKAASYKEGADDSQGDGQGIEVTPLPDTLEIRSSLNRAA